ncbi:MAG: efflux RND transporter periplasmic adaptor subunit [Myxococcota bacterium]
MGHDGAVRNTGLVLCITACAVAGCDAAPAANAARAKSKNGKEGNKASRAPSPVAVAPASKGPIASYYVTTTTLEPERIAPVQARVEGIIRRINHEEGDLVRKDAPLLQIDQRQYKLRVDQLAAKTAQLRDSYQRLKRMVSQQLVGAEEFEQVRHDLEAARAEENIARLNLSYTTVRAPFTGRVIKRNVEVGHKAETTTQLFELADLEPLLARVFVPSRAFNRLAKDQPVELELDSNKVRLSGRIKLVSPIIDPTSGTIKVTLEIPQYPEGTRPGDFAHVRITTEKHDDALLVPRIAVVQKGQQRIVFVVVDGRAQQRTVEVGFENDDSAEILKGLADGEMVIIKGQTSLQDGAAVRVLKADA